MSGGAVSVGAGGSAGGSGAGGSGAGGSGAGAAPARPVPARPARARPARPPPPASSASSAAAFARRAGARRVPSARSGAGASPASSASIAAAFARRAGARRVPSARSGAGAGAAAAAASKRLERRGLGAPLRPLLAESDADVELIFLARPRRRPGRLPSQPPRRGRRCQRARRGVGGAGRGSGCEKSHPGCILCSRAAGQPGGSRRCPETRRPGRLKAERPRGGRRLRVSDSAPAHSPRPRHWTAARGPPAPNLRAGWDLESGGDGVDPANHADSDPADHGERLVPGVGHAAP